LRQPILYAEEVWRRQRLWVLLILAVGLVMGGFSFVQRRAAGDLNFLIFLAYIPAALLLGIGLLVYRRRSYVETTERGLKVSNLLGSILIDYDHVRWAKVYPLSNHFQAQDRRRYVRTANRALLPRPALYVKLGGDEADLARVNRKLGRTFVDGDVLAVPLPDPDGMSWDLAGRLPERAHSNLGGQRRKRRRR
jgi:hypothetical protein